MTKNPLSFLLAGFRYLLHGFSAGRLFDRCRFGRLSRRIFWETAAADAVVLLLTFFVPLEIAYRLQLEPESLFLRVRVAAQIMTGLFPSLSPFTPTPGSSVQAATHSSKTAVIHIFIWV